MTRLRSYKGVSYPAVLADIDGAAGLHPISQRRLALLLVESLIIFEQFKQVDTTVSPGTSAAKIKNLLGSLDLLSKFARDTNGGLPNCGAEAADDPASRDAMMRIIWTADDIGPAARQSVINLFSEVEQVYQIARQAEREMAMHVREKEPIRAIAWLCGERLPEVYSQIFRRDFTTTRGGKNPGIVFVQNSLRALNISENLSEETIISHRKAVLRVKESETP